MSRKILSAVWIALSMTPLLLNSAAYAQATRTWVSGVGDDANPCSRTAPCKTFAGAISKTAVGGEIDVLDPGGFGAVTITKSISIESEGTLAGVLVSGTNGIIVNASATDVVVLRGLTIDGLGTGLSGVKFLAGGTLVVEGCSINHFTQKGIDFEPSGASQLFVTNTAIRDNQGASSGGVIVLPTGAGSAKASLRNVQLENNSFGLRAEANSKVTLSQSLISGNSANGIVAISAGAAAEVTIDNSVISHNASNGIRADGAAGVVRISNNTINNNVAFGLTATNSGKILSFGSNNIDGNGTNGDPTQSLTPK